MNFEILSCCLSEFLAKLCRGDLSFLGQFVLLLFSFFIIFSVSAAGIVTVQASPAAPLSVSRFLPLGSTVSGRKGEVQPQSRQTELVSKQKSYTDSTPSKLQVRIRALADDLILRGQTGNQNLDADENLQRDIDSLIHSHSLGVTTISPSRSRIIEDENKFATSAPASGNLRNFGENASSFSKSPSIDYAEYNEMQKYPHISASKISDDFDPVTACRKTLLMLPKILREKGLEEEWVEANELSLYASLALQFSSIPVLRDRLEGQGYDFTAEKSVIENIVTMRFPKATERCRTDIATFMFDSNYDPEWGTYTPDEWHEHCDSIMIGSSWSGMQEVGAASRYYGVRIQLFTVSEHEVLERMIVPALGTDEESTEGLEMIRLIRLGNFFWSAKPIVSRNIQELGQDRRSEVKITSDDAGLEFSQQRSESPVVSNQPRIKSFGEDGNNVAEIEIHSHTHRLNDQLDDRIHFSINSKPDEELEPVVEHVSSQPLCETSNVTSKENSRPDLNLVSYINYRAEPMDFSNITSRVFNSKALTSPNTSVEKHSFLRKGRQKNRAKYVAGADQIPPISTDEAAAQSPRAGLLFRDQLPKLGTSDYNAKLKNIPSVVSKYWTAPAEAFNLTIGDRVHESEMDENGRGIFADIKTSKDGGTSSASTGFEDSSEFRTLRQVDHSTDILESNVERVLMEDFFKETIHLATPKAPQRSIGRDSQFALSTPYRLRATPPPPPSPSDPRSSSWISESKSRARRQRKSCGATSSYGLSAAVGTAETEIKAGKQSRLESSVTDSVVSPKESRSKTQSEDDRRQASKKDQVIPKPADESTGLVYVVKDLLQFVKNSEDRHAESLKFLFSRNSELAEAMAAILNQTGRVDQRSWTEERIALVERGLEAKLRELKMNETDNTQNLPRKQEPKESQLGNSNATAAQAASEAVAPANSQRISTSLDNGGEQEHRVRNNDQTSQANTASRFPQDSSPQEAKLSSQRQAEANTASRFPRDSSPREARLSSQRQADANTASRFPHDSSLREAKLSSQRQAEARLEEGLENHLVDSERSESSYEYPPQGTRRAHARRHDRAKPRDRESRGFDVQFPNSMWQSDYGDAPSVYFREQVAAWDRRLAAEISAAVPAVDAPERERWRDPRTRSDQFDFSLPWAPGAESWADNFNSMGMGAPGSGANSFGLRGGYAGQGREPWTEPWKDRSMGMGAPEFAMDTFGRTRNGGPFPPRGGFAPAADGLQRSELDYPLREEDEPSFPPLPPMFGRRPDDAEDHGSHSLTAKALRVGQEVEEARDRVERAREALAVVVEDAARKGEDAERLKAALDEIRLIRCVYFRPSSCGSGVCVRVRRACVRACVRVCVCTPFC